MVRGKSIQAVLALVSFIFALLAFKPGINFLVREGMLTAAAAIWLFRVEMRASGRFRPQVRQLGTILVLGLLLCKTGSIEYSSYIWDGASARAAMAGMLSWTIGLLAIPSCICFYLCTPRKRVRTYASTSTMKRPKMTHLEEGYRMAV